MNESEDTKNTDRDPVLEIAALASECAQDAAWEAGQGGTEATATLMAANYVLRGMAHLAREIRALREAL